MDCQRDRFQLHGYRSIEQLAMVHKEDSEQKMSKMTITSVSLTDFKGTQKATYTFGPGVNVILGPNGSGKTTIADGYMYSMSGKDFSLTTNPVITPNNKPADASETQVTVNGEIDGKAIEIVRSQKTRFSKPDANGVRKVTSVNSYSINSVAMAERDAVKRFAEYGIDMDLFTILAHPEVFVNQAMGDKKSKDKARMTVFSMANPLPDIEIANKAGTKELAELLENYTITEIGEQQKATRRKILAEYGKNGDILMAKIQAAESMVVRFDEAEMTARKAELEAKKAECSDRLSSFDAMRTKKTALETMRVDLYNRIVTARQEASQDNLNKAFEARERYSKKVSEYNRAVDKAEDDERKLASLYDRIASLKGEREKLNGSLQAKMALVFDETSTVCPVCKRKYPAKQADSIRAEFEEEKANAIKAIEDAIRKVNANLGAIQANSELGEKILAEDRAKVESLKVEAEALEKEYKAIPQTVDETTLPVYAGFKAEIDRCNEEIAKIDEALAESDSYQVSINRITEAIKEIQKREAQAELNKSIEAKIAEYRALQTTYEQTIARTEMIEAQIALFGRTKNEMLTESINSHFKVVSWKLFDYQKNGEYKECLIPMIGSTPYDSLSGGEKMVAMVDIVTTLQRWFDTYLPVFIDEAGIATSDTLGQIRGLANTQIILLKAEDTKDGEIIVKSLG